MLVLGEEPQKHGLSISLLERLYDCYHALGDVAKPYCAHLHTNFRCHRKILDLARQVAYKMHLDCKVPDHSAHPRAEFPLRFVCTSLDADVGATHKSINEDEVQVALKEASRFFMEWPPHHWGKRDLSQICFLSPCRGQVCASACYSDSVSTADVEKLYCVAGYCCSQCQRKRASTPSEVGSKSAYIPDSRYVCDHLCICTS